MNDLFRAIFGVQPTGQYGERMDERLPKDHKNNFTGNFGGDDDDDDDDHHHNVNMRRGPEGGIFGFPLFNDPGEVHKHFERLVDGMNRAFEVFTFGNGPSITWESDNSNASSFYREEPQERHQSLRDAYLKKPDCSCDKISQNDTFNLGSNIKPLGPGMSTNTIQLSHPKVYSKTVFIQTVRRPDGSVETIKKVTDHEGNEETTITQSNVNEPLPNPQQQNHLITPKEDTSGLSILKKFFSF